MFTSPLRRRLLWLAVPVLLLGLGFAWWTISPLFLTTSVDEAFPAAAQGAAPAGQQADPAGQHVDPTSQHAMPTGQHVDPTSQHAMPAGQHVDPTSQHAMPAGQHVDPTSQHAMPTVQQALPTSQQALPTSQQALPTSQQALPTAQEAATNVPAEPVALSSGSFTFIDNLHWAEGTATIYQLADGGRVLRLEPFTAQNGPDLFVGLSGHPMPRSSAEAHDSGYVELERLKANQGNQNYAIPADLDLSAFQSVVIYCKAFSVVFSTAELMN
jgi:cytoskeletal protein RodZ